MSFSRQMEERIVLKMRMSSGIFCRQSSWNTCWGICVNFFLFCISKCGLSYLLTVGESFRQSSIPVWNLFLIELIFPCQIKQSTRIHSGFHSSAIVNSTSITAKKILFAKRFHGMPQLDNFQLEVENLPELKTGGCLKIFQSLILSCCQ